MGELADGSFEPLHASSSSHAAAGRIENDITRLS